MKNWKLLLIAVLTIVIGVALFGVIYISVFGKTKNGDAVPVTQKEMKPVIKQQPQSVTVDDGDMVTFTVEATGAETYQWQYSTDEGETWVNSSGNGYNTNSLSFEVKEKFSGRIYRCKLSNNDGSTISEAVTFTLYDRGPEITVHPQDITADDGEEVSFTVEAVNATGYQWQYSTDGGESWANSAGNGFDTNTMSFTVLGKYAGRMYRCKVSDEDGTSTSEAAKLTVNVKGPVITKQPQSASAELDETVTFSVEATDVVAYQWQYSTDNGATWVNSSGTGSKTESMTFTMVKKFGGRMYRCKMKNEEGTTISEAVSLTLK